MHEVQSIVHMGSNSSTQSQGEFLSDQVKTMAMQAIRFDCTIGDKISDRKGKCHCLFKDANSIIEQDKAIDYYDDEVQSAVSMEKDSIGRRHATDVLLMT